MITNVVTNVHKQLRYDVKDLLLHGVDKRDNLTFGDEYTDCRQIQVKVDKTGSLPHSQAEARYFARAYRKDTQAKHFNLKGTKPLQAPCARFLLHCKEWDVARRSIRQLHKNKIGISRLYTYFDSSEDLIAISVYVSLPLYSTSGKQYNVEFFY